MLERASVEMGKLSQVDWVDATLAEFAFADKRLSLPQGSRHLDLGQPSVEPGFPQPREHHLVPRIVNRSRAARALG